MADPPTLRSQAVRGRQCRNCGPDITLYEFHHVSLKQIVTNVNHRHFEERKINESREAQIFRTLGLPRFAVPLNAAAQAVWEYSCSFKRYNCIITLIPRTSPLYFNRTQQHGSQRRGRGLH